MSLVDLVHGSYANDYVIRDNLYYLIMATVPAILGYLQRTRHDLAGRPAGSRRSQRRANTSSSC
ncbi:hypothetical protein L0U85_04690 [Glycomyces sp. L485]|nr:hypothetical protein [Glycomyces sp. L485]MCH7230162.1 hypothetical protein [Glycomyces sp. L485]